MKENKREQEGGSALDLALIKIKAQITEVASTLNRKEFPRALTHGKGNKRKGERGNHVDKRRISCCCSRKQ
jgi:hypothetical protein